MKIGFDLRFHLGYSGTAVYNKEVIHHLLAEQSLSIYLFGNKRKLERLKEYYPSKDRQIYMPVFPNELMLGNRGKSLVEAYCDWRWRQESKKLDLIHCTSTGSYPMGIKNGVVSIHDLFPLWESPQKPIRINFEKKLKEISKHARVIFTLTESVKAKLCESHRFNPEKIRVTYAAANNQFDKRSEIPDLPKRYGVEAGQRYFLVVARDEPRKNLLLTLQAYSRLPGTIKKDIRLLIVTVPSKEIEKAAGTEPGVIIAPNVPFEHIVGLYQSAFAFVFMTLDEGFGIPIIEAMKSGVPVLTSDVPSIREVASTAALYKNPRSVEAIAEGMMELYENAMLREHLIKAGTERAGFFSWKKTTDIILNGYREALT